MIRHVLGGRRILSAPLGVAGGGFVPADVPQSEADALIWLYEHTDGPNWTNNTNWLIDPIVNNWYGITVAGGHVTFIDLRANGATMDGDIGAWAIDDFTALDFLYLSNTDVSGDVSAWTFPASVSRIWLASTNVSGDITGWSLPPLSYSIYLGNNNLSGDISSWALPASLGWFSIDSGNIAADISGWSFPAGFMRLMAHNNSNVSIGGPTDIGSAITLRRFDISNCNLAQSEVDQFCLDIYTARAVYTYATPVLIIHGTNAAPSGIYQYAAVPSTGKEYIYALENDDDGEGFNKWSITYTP